MSKHRATPTITTHPIDIFSRTVVGICAVALGSVAMYCGGYLMGWL